MSKICILYDNFTTKVYWKKVKKNIKRKIDKKSMMKIPMIILINNISLKDVPFFSYNKKMNN